MVLIYLGLVTRRSSARDDPLGLRLASSSGVLVDGVVGGGAIDQTLERGMRRGRALGIAALDLG